MKSKLKYFLTSFIGALAILFAGMYILDNYEGTSIDSVLWIVGFVMAAMLGWVYLMAKLILR